MLQPMQQLERLQIGVGVEAEMQNQNPIDLSQTMQVVLVLDQEIFLTNLHSHCMLAIWCSQQQKKTLPHSSATQNLCALYLTK